MFDFISDITPAEYALVAVNFMMLFLSRYFNNKRFFPLGRPTGTGAMTAAIVVIDLLWFASQTIA